MARLPRCVIPGQAQHMIQRGNIRQLIVAADADKYAVRVFLPASWRYFKPTVGFTSRDISRFLLEEDPG